VRLADAGAALLLRATTGRLDYALDATGSLALVGYPGLTAAGTVRVRLNSFTTGLDLTVALVGGTGDLRLAFAADEVAGTGAFTAITATGATLQVLGQTFTADLAITRDGSGLTIGVTGLALALGGSGSGVGFTPASTSPSRAWSSRRAPPAGPPPRSASPAANSRSAPAARPCSPPRPSAAASPSTPPGSAGRSPPPSPPGRPGSTSAPTSPCR
jgi:hypothetical protein